MRLLSIATLLLIGISCTTTVKIENAKITFSDSLTVFGEGIISTIHKERDLAISPDGNMILFTRSAPGRGVSAIFMVKKTDDQWGEPAVAMFSGQYTDLEPAFSPDGGTLFFASNRPIQGSEPKDFDIWKVPVDNGTFGDAERLDTLINTSGNEFYPSVARSGNLYYTAAYDFDNKKEDIYVAKWQNGKYTQPETLPSSVCGATYEFNAFVSPEEDYIIYTAYGRADDMGGGDLYINKKENGEWQQAQRLKDGINSKSLDYCPFVSPDGKYFFFTSNKSAFKQYYNKPLTTSEFEGLLNSTQNGNGSIYVMSFDQI